MATQQYTIRPLTWKRSFNDYSQTYEAEGCYGEYQVTRHREDCEEHGPQCQIDSHGKWSSWKWQYAYCEYYDDGSDDCATAKEGKAKAEEHWQAYLIAVLVPVGQPQP